MKTIHWKQVTVAVVIGFLLGNAFSACPLRNQFFRAAKPSLEQKKEKLLERFVSELRLTPAQKGAVEKILESKTKQMEMLRSEVRPKFKAIRSEMREQISAVLTPEQRPRFEAMERKWEERKEHKRWNRD